MKLITKISILACFVFSAVQMIGQGTMTEGYIKMEITDIVSSDPQIQAMSDMLKGTTQEVYFSGDKGLMVMNMMGGMMKITTLTNAADKSGLMLYEGLGNRYKIPFSSDDAEERQAQTEEQMGAMSFEYDKEDKKNIAGYDCHKVSISSEDMKEFKLEAYVTQDIKTNVSVMQGIEGSKLEGYPLEYILDAGQFKMVYTATSIEKTFDKEVFNLDTSGMTEKTMEEFMEIMSSFGGGGMGF